MTQLATDNFTRADAANLGASWTIPTGDHGIAVVSNQLATGTFSCVEFYNGVTWPNDQYAQIVHKTVCTVSDNGIGPAVRITSGGNLYFAQTSTSETRLYKRVSGSYTQIGSDGPAMASGDLAYIEVQGTSLIVKKNGTTIIGPVTDASIGSGNAGVWSTDITATADDWAGGDFGGGGGRTFFVRSGLDGLSTSGPKQFNPSLG